MKSFWMLLVLLAFAPQSDVRASAWIGCDACSNPEISPMCSTCPGVPQSQPSLVPPWSSPYLQWCPTCNAYVSSPNYSYAMQPYWMNQSQNYWNFYGPGPYNGYGIMPQYYPQPMPYYNPMNNFQPNIPGGNGGGVYLDKPVVYMTGPTGTKVQVYVDQGGTAKDKHEVLVAVPAFSHSKMGSGWNAVIDGKTLRTDKGDYEYFFYDAWADDKIFQDKEGYCADRKEILDYMSSGLKQRGFPENSIQDFKMTWNIKLPFNQNLCVYPQTEKELQAGVKLTFEPANVELIQLEFIVVPKSYFSRPEAKGRPRFSAAPGKDFVRFKPTSMITGRTVAGTAAATAKAPTIKAYDWGVGFIRVQGTEHENAVRKPDSKKNN